MSADAPSSGAARHLLPQAGEGTAPLSRPGEGPGVRVLEKRVAATLAVLLIVFGLGLPATWNSYRASLPPLDLAAATEGSTLVVDRDGRLLRAFTLRDGRWRLPIEPAQVDPRYLQMLVAYEDGRFYDHHGVDARALARAAWQWATRLHIVSGGSTLSMQVARILEPREERTLSAKLRQITRAIEIERAVGKEGVLSRYLTSAPMGGNLEGVRAASLAYFGKEPLRLTLGEAALLVALPQAPEWRRPDKNFEAARRARARVLERAYARGVITAEQRDAALGEPIPTTRRDFPELAAHAAEEAVAADPQAKLIRLTIDARLQAKLEALAKSSVEKLGEKLSAAIVVIDNKSGEIRARIGAADYLDATRGGSIDMSRARAFAGFGAETLHLCAGLRAGPRPSRNPALRPSRPLRRLSARKFRPGFCGRGDGAQGVAAIVEPAGRRGALGARPGKFSGPTTWRGR